MANPPTPDPLILSFSELMSEVLRRSSTQPYSTNACVVLTPDHEATYVYTSGTTGPPKGVVQTHGNHLFMVQSCGAILTAEEGDVDLLFLPLAHSFARLRGVSRAVYWFDHGVC